MKWLVWYTDINGRGDSTEVEADTKDDAADWVMDHDGTVDTVDSVELLD